MNWHKAGWGLIVMLTLLCVFLAVLVFRTVKESRQLPEEMVAEAIENLAGGGIHVLPEAVDTRVYENILYAYNAKTVTADELNEENEESKEEASCFAGILSALSEKNGRELYLDIPNGVSVSLVSEDEKAIGVVLLTGKNSLEYHREEPFDMEEAEWLLAASETAELSSGASRALGAFFNAAYPNGAIGYSVLRTVETETDGRRYTLVSCCLTLDGLPVTDAPLTAVLGEYGARMEITDLRGKVFFREPQGVNKNPLIDGMNILYDLHRAFDGSLTVEREELVYRAFGYQHDRDYLVPCWLLSCADDMTGESREFCLDAVTGHVLP